jgi:hypothetical protein
MKIFKAIHNFHSFACCILRSARIFLQADGAFSTENGTATRSKDASQPFFRRSFLQLSLFEKKVCQFPARLALARSLHLSPSYGKQFNRRIRPKRQSTYR